MKMEPMQKIALIFLLSVITLRVFVPESFTPMLLRSSSVFQID